MEGRRPVGRDHDC